MAAPTTEQVGIDFLLRAGGTLIGGAQNATYNRSTALTDVTNKDSGRHQENRATTMSASIDFDAGFLEGSQQTGQGVTVGVDDGAGGYNNLSDVTNVSIDLSMSLIDRTDADSARWRELLPGTRSTTLSVEQHYVDPESETAFADLLAAHDAGTPIGLQVTLGSFVLEADFLVTSDGFSTPQNGAVDGPLSLTMTDTAPTWTYASNDAGLGALLDALLADPPESLTALIEVVDPAGTQISGATGYSGTFYPESLSIAIPYDGEATVSGTLQNDGAVTRATQT